MEIAIVILLWLFICLQLLVITGFLSISKNRFKPNNFPKVAILVPARNEAQHIAECLESLLQLNYPKELLEIWVGNDQSTDDTASIVQVFEDKHPHIHLYHVGNNMGSAKAKGNVLAHLVKLCEADYIFVTDADIAVGKNWIMGLLPLLQQPQMGMVSGTTLVKGKGFLEEGQSLDWTLGNGYLIGLNQLGLKSTAVGNNMAFTRQAYLATGGYENLPFSVTEDFQLFSAIRAKGFNTENVLDKASLNISKPQYNFNKLLHQRKRWMMGAQALPWYWAPVFGIQAFFYLGIFILACLNLNLAIKIWAMKWVLQQSYLLLIHQRLQEKMPWRTFFGYEAYSLFMHVAMIVFYLSPTKMDWKGRKYLWGFLLSLGLFTSCKEKGMPHIDIVMAEPISWTNKEACTIRYAQGGDTLTMPGKLKCRGGFSSRFPKASFALSLEEKFSLGDLPADKDWILNANYIDKTFMRHKLNYDLFTQMDANNRAAQSVYIKLSINNAYKGLYVLMEELDASTLNLDKKDSMAFIFKDPPIFYQYNEAVNSDSGNYYNQKFPKISKQNKQWFMHAFNAFLYQSSDSLFLKEIGQWIDINNVIDWHLILLLSNNSDGILKNFFLYKKNAASPLKLAIWDYDHSYGRDGDNTLNVGPGFINCERSILLKRLLHARVSTYPQNLKKRYHALRRSKVFSKDNLYQKIAENEKRLLPEINNNFLRWPFQAEAYVDANNFEQELAIMRNFIKLRLQVLDTEFEYL